MREDKSTEFKSEISKSYLKTVSAFANYAGGKIYFGIDDHGVAIGLKGDLNKLALNIENQINDSIIPRPDYSLEPKVDKEIIILTVDKGYDTPYLFNGKAYKRNDS